MDGSSNAVGAQLRCLEIEPFEALVGELVLWRQNDEVWEMARTKAAGRIFDFVKGLRFSARLIYIIRDALSEYGLQADWGQVVADDGHLLSPECDVIIHRPGFVRRWNGDKHGQVMDFKFVRRRATLAVISCKSKVNSVTKKMRAYSERMRPYLRRKPWLFAECCPPRKAAKLEADATAAGYQAFWYLYSWDPEKKTVERDERVWTGFLKSLVRLGTAAAKGGTGR